jgi:hypothetical protein
MNTSIDDLRTIPIADLVALIKQAQAVKKERKKEVDIASKEAKEALRAEQTIEGKKLAIIGNIVKTLYKEQDVLGKITKVANTVSLEITDLERNPIINEKNAQVKTWKHFYQISAYNG